jgi:hypothetical protein
MWNYYYNFEGEFQLAGWKIREKNPDGSVRIVCETELKKEAAKNSRSTIRGNPNSLRISNVCPGNWKSRGAGKKV